MAFSLTCPDLPVAQSMQIAEARIEWLNRGRVSTDSDITRKMGSIRISDNRTRCRKSESAQCHFTDCLSAFDERMGPLQVLDVDGAKRLRLRRAQHTTIDKVRNTVQQSTLLRHVWRLPHRARKHELPMERRRFTLKWHYIERLRIVDQAQFSLWSQDLGQLCKVPRGRRQAGDIFHRGRVQSLHLFGQRLGVIDDVVSTQLCHPFH